MIYKFLKTTIAQVILNSQTSTTKEVNNYKDKRKKNTLSFGR